jgi:predicted DNA-binding transcriptional regulator AlpA
VSQPPITQAAEVPPLLLDAAGAAKLVSVSTRHWLRLADRGKAPAGIHLGRRRLWSREEIETWIRNGCPVLRRCV